jgi:hypothetical protein
LSAPLGGGIEQFHVMYSLDSAAKQIFSSCSEDSREKLLGLTRWRTKVGVAGWKNAICERSVGRNFDCCGQFLDKWAMTESAGLPAFLA